MLVGLSFYQKKSEKIEKYVIYFLDLFLMSLPLQINHALQDFLNVQSVTLRCMILIVTMESDGVQKVG